MNAFEPLPSRSEACRAVASAPAAPAAFRVRVWEVISRGRGPRTERAPPEGVGLRPGPEPAERLRARSVPDIKPRVISIKSGGSDRRSSPDTSRLGAAGDFQA